MSEEFKDIEKLGKSTKRKWLDAVLGVALVLVILFLAHALLSQLALKSEVKNAKTVTNQMINDVRKQDGTSARKLGTKTFQAQNTATNLTGQFQTASKFTTGTPSIDHQTVTNDKTGQAVSIIYKFPKPAFYVRVIVFKAKGTTTFQVANLNANTTEKPLLSNKY